MQGAIHDFRQAVRSLMKSPGFSLTVIVTLALGIGANTAIFSLLNAMLLRPLGVRDPGSLVVVRSVDRQTSWPQSVWEEIRDREILDGGFAWFWNRFDEAGRGERQLVDGIAIGANAFDTLGLKPEIGRLLTSSDDKPGAPDGLVAVISYRFWQRRFGGSPSVLGRVMTLDHQSYTLVGVTPREFVGLDIGLPFDVAIPLHRQQASGRAFRPYVAVMGRLRPGQTANALIGALQAAQAGIRDATNPYKVEPYRAEYLASPFTVQGAAGGESFLQRRYERPFKTLFVVVGFVLLIACGNIAMLTLARATRLKPEMAVRVALGASWARIIRQSVMESLVLSSAGALGGLMLVPSCIILVTSSLSTQSYTVFLQPAPDWRVFAFAAAAAVTTAIVFGGWPAMHATRVDPIDALRQRRAVRGETLGAASGILLLQVAVSLVLVVTAGLFVRTFVAIAGIEVGFEPDRVLVVNVDAERSGVEPAQRGLLYQRVLDAVSGSIGIESAGLSLEMPGGNATRTPWIDLEDGTALPQGPGGVYEHRVSSGWFRTLGTRIVAGRGFDGRDRIGAPTTALVNETFVRLFLRDSVALGQTIFESNEPDGPRQPLLIVGVVEDAMYRSLKETPPPTVYRTISQMTGPLRDSVALSVRHAGQTPGALSRALAETIVGVDPNLSISFRTLSDQVAAQYSQERLVAAVAGFFGALALLLAAVGLYGVTAYTVSGRRFELGIRMALGAAPSCVVRLLLGRVTRLVVGGILLGFLVSLWAGRVVESMLYGVQPQDPMTFWLAGMAVITTTALATAWPARRAARVNPAILLRTE